MKYFEKVRLDFDGNKTRLMFLGVLGVFLSLNLNLLATGTVCLWISVC